MIFLLKLSFLLFRPGDELLVFLALGMEGLVAECFADRSPVFQKQLCCLAEVSCPVLLLHRLDDEVIPISSSKNACKKLSCKHQLILFDGGKHRMLYDNTIQNNIFPIIECMIEGKLVN